MAEKVDGGDAGQQLGAEHLGVEAATFGEQFVEQQELDPGAEQLAEQAVDVAAGITTLMENLGKCERIFKTPIPRVYTRHTERFLAAWLFTLPLGLYDVTEAVGHWTMLPVVLLVSVFLVGIGELAIVIEEPFSILPLNTMCAGIQSSVFADLKNAELRQPTAAFEKVEATLPLKVETERAAEANSKGA